ncbi:hypothetical protein PWT90_02986 [Aphanocladium album]|nr:hypothetical protein PWT90_02986 [Aphanocladium album]
MGMLQENKSRKKISNDPNNTKWTRDTTTFGQKILRSQGWQPGQFLGAQDAPHAELHSAASASYIRVVLKDDMKGLGFNKAKEDEVTGLDVFSDLLSRLNGKSEAAVQEDQQARLAIKTNRYVEMRWGPMRFVRGGLLVGDKLKEDEGSADLEEESSAEEGEKQKKKPEGSEVKKSKKDKKTKKRKAEDEDEEESDSEVTDKKDKKRRRKDEDEDAKAEKKRRKKEEKKKDKKKSKKSSKKDESDDSDDSDDEKAAKKKAKKDKKDKKREKREKKEEKKRLKAAKAAASSDSSSSDSEDSDEDGSASTPAATSGTSTPLTQRNYSRSRYIAQKRQAVMDAKALAQIFMIKA